MSHDINIAGTADDHNYGFAYNGVAQLTSKTLSETTPQWLPLADRTVGYQSNGLNRYTGGGLQYDGNSNLTRDTEGRAVATALRPASRVY